METSRKVARRGREGEREVFSLGVRRRLGALPAAAQAGPFGGPVPAPGAAQPMTPGAGAPVMPVAPAPTQPAPPATPAPRPGVFPAQPTQTPPGTTAANPVAPDQPPAMTPDELPARRTAPRNQQTQSECPNVRP